MALTCFEWDPVKDLENQRKHGVSFMEAQYVFADSSRVIAEDLGHSAKEKRYYCFGRVAQGVMTVRSLIVMESSASLGQDTGVKESRSMSVKTKYTNEPLGEYRVVSDFLPPPSELAFRDEGVKVTIALSKRSVEFFKSHAARNQTQYQRMIRQLLDAYVDAHTQPLNRRSTGTSRRRPTR